MENLPSTIIETFGEDSNSVMESPSFLGIGLPTESIRKTTGTANFASADQF